MSNNITTLFSDTAAAIRERNYSTQVIAEEEIQNGELYYTSRGEEYNKYASQYLGFGQFIITYDNIKYLCEVYGSVIFAGQPALGNERLWQKYNNGPYPSDDFHEENVPFYIICDTYTTEYLGNIFTSYEWSFLCEDDKPHTIKVEKCITPFRNLIADDFPKLISEIPTGIKLPANQSPITITINWNTVPKTYGMFGNYNSFICYVYKVDENNIIQSFADEYKLIARGGESGTITYKIPPNTSIEFYLSAIGPNGAFIDIYTASGYKYPGYPSGMETYTIFFPEHKIINDSQTLYHSETLNISFDCNSGL